MLIYLKLSTLDGNHLILNYLKNFFPKASPMEPFAVSSVLKPNSALTEDIIICLIVIVMTIKRKTGSLGRHATRGTRLHVRRLSCLAQGGYSMSLNR